MDVLARRDRRGRKADDLAVAADRLADRDRPDRNLVAGRNALHRGDALGHDDARRQARARDQHAIIGMQSDDGRWGHVGVSLALAALPLPVLYGESIGRGRSKSRLAAGILAGLPDLHPGIGRHQSAFIRQRHELEAHVDRAHRALGAAAVDARIQAALAALLHDLLIDLQDFRLLAIEFWDQTVGKAEIGGADIDAVDAVDIEDRFHVFDRRLGFHHREQHDLLVGRLLIGAGRTIHAGTDRAVGTRAARRVFGVGDEVFRLLLGVDHRTDHAIGAAVEYLADDARLVPGHAHHRRHRMTVHRLKALHHRLVILHAVLHVDGDAVEAALRDHLGGKSRRDRKPGVHHRLARSPYFFDVVCCHCVSFPCPFTPSLRAKRSNPSPQEPTGMLRRYAPRNDGKITRPPAGCSPRSRRLRARYSLSPPRYRQARARRSWCALRAFWLPARPGSARRPRRRRAWYP